MAYIEVPGWKGKFLLGPRHSYWWVDKKGSEPRPLSGITSVLNVIGKPKLVQWAANCSVDFIKSNVSAKQQEDGSFVIEGDEFMVLLEEARTAHATKRDAAADTGKDAHALIEEYIKTCLDKNKGIPWNQITSAEPRVLEFAVWAMRRNQKTGFTFVASETPLADPKLAIAGTPDFIAIEKNEAGEWVLVIGDLKTGSGIYDRVYFAQMAAYGYMYLRKTRKKQGVRLVIVHAPASKPGQPIAEYWSEDHKGDWEGFKSALYLHRWKDNFAKPV